MDSSGTGVVTLAQTIGSLTGPTLLVLVIIFLVKGVFRIGSQVTQEIQRLEAEIARLRADNAAKDLKLDHARDALMDKVIPVLTKAITVMERDQKRARGQ